MPAGTKVLPLRSNIEAISEFVFSQMDTEFASRAHREGTGIIVGGENYGQGSSREHAAIAPRYLGVRAKLAKNFSRIHKANLINFGILPLVFVNSDDIEGISQGDKIRIEGVKHALEQRNPNFMVQILASGKRIPLRLEATDREFRMLLAGGLINMAE